MQLKDWEKSYSGECWQHRTNPETVSSPSWTADSIRQCDRPAFEIFFYTFTHTFTRTHARMHARTHARTHTHARTRTHARMHVQCSNFLLCLMSAADNFLQLFGNFHRSEMLSPTFNMMSQKTSTSKGQESNYRQWLRHFCTFIK